MPTTCRKCSSEFESNEDGAVCPQCLKALDVDLKVINAVHSTLLTLALVISVTGVIFFIIAASRGSDSGAFNVGRKGNLRTTPTGMYILSGSMVVGAIGLAVGVSRSKRKWEQRVDEYYAPTNKESGTDAKNSFL